jgi:methylthioribose-1-phosphate isomerase
MFGNRSNPASPPATLAWIGDISGHLRLLDQTELPGRVAFRDCHTVEQLWDAIRRLQVRGAPAIGVAAAYGVVLGMRQVFEHTWEAALQQLRRITNHLASSRPTAVNLFWALERMEAVGTQASGGFDLQRYRERLLAEARAIELDDKATCRAIGEHGASLIPDAAGVLTHCNAGSLATSGEGTALAVLYEASRQGKRFHVFVDETRPLLQGARLTAWELQQRALPCMLICDSMAGALMKAQRVQLVIVGADRIAANGDTANKIGTYSLAVLARHHDIPFYVAAPRSTFDSTLASGMEIPIEERAGEEITRGFGKATAPPGIRTHNPAFDVTPASLISAIITERGLIRPVQVATINDMLTK